MYYSSTRTTGAHKKRGAPLKIHILKHTSYIRKERGEQKKGMLTSSWLDDSSKTKIRLKCRSKNSKGNAATFIFNEDQEKWGRSQEHHIKQKLTGKKRGYEKEHRGINNLRKKPRRLCPIERIVLREHKPLEEGGK